MNDQTIELIRNDEFTLVIMWMDLDAKFILFEDEKEIAAEDFSFEEGIPHPWDFMHYHIGVAI